MPFTRQTGEAKSKAKIILIYANNHNLQLYRKKI